MTTQRDLDRDLGPTSTAQHQPGTRRTAGCRPDWVESTRQQPRLLVTDRWRPRQLVNRAILSPRVVAVVTVVLLLIALATVLAVIGSSRRPAPPFGLAKPGLIAFDANGDLFASNPDGSGLVQLTSGPEFEALPAYSPDGTLIAFESEQPDFSFDVFVMPADGGERVQVIEGLAETVRSPGRRTAVTSRSRLGRSARIGRQILIGAIDDPGAVRLGGPDVFGSDPAWSPDSRQIAFHRTTCCGEALDSLWVINVDGSNAHEVAPDIWDSRVQEAEFTRGRTGHRRARPHGRRTVGGSRSWRRVSASCATCTSSTPTGGICATSRTAPSRRTAWPGRRTERASRMCGTETRPTATRSSWSPMRTARTRAPSPAPP